MIDYFGNMSLKWPNRRRKTHGSPCVGHFLSIMLVEMILNNKGNTRHKVKLLSGRGIFLIHASQ
jgi:hypothetical protein